MVESTEQVSGFTFRSEEFRVIGLRPTLLCFPAAAPRPAVTVGRARLTHQGLHLQLLHRVRVAQRESAADRGEQEQKNLGLHCRLREESCHWVTSVRAAPARQRRRRAPAPRVPSTKMAQPRRMLMCYFAGAIRSCGPWTLSQHLGPSKETASNIPPASHSGSHTLQSRQGAPPACAAVCSVCRERHVTLLLLRVHTAKHANYSALKPI